MSKFVMVVQSRAKDGRDDEYNHWYDTQHFDDICAIPGVTSGRRFEATPIMLGTPGLKYLSIYEIETEDAGSFMAELGKRASEGKMPGSDALDSESAVLWIYEQRAS